MSDPVIKFVENAEMDGSDTIEFTFNKNRGSIMIELDSPWHGDSRCGFGETLFISLNKEQTKELATWLSNMLEEAA